MILDLIQVKKEPKKKKKKLMKRLNGIIRYCRKDGDDKIYFIPLSFSLTRNANMLILIWIYHINSLCMDDEIGLVHLLMIHGGSQSFRTEACCHCHIFACQFISFYLFIYFFWVEIYTFCLSISLLLLISGKFWVKPL